MTDIPALAENRTDVTGLSGHTVDYGYADP